MDLHDVELFRRQPGVDAIDKDWVRRAIKTMCALVRKRGRFDFVICDSVFNSVDTPEAEKAVATVLGLLCKVGGTIFYSGRSMKYIEQMMRTTKQSGLTKMEFLDKDGFSGYFLKGQWFFQKYHTDVEAANLSRFMGGEAELLEYAGVWKCRATKTHEVSWQLAKEAIEFEFNLGWPEEQSIGMVEEVLKTFRPFYEEQIAQDEDNAKL